MHWLWTLNELGTLSSFHSLMANRQPAAPAAYRGQVPPVHPSPGQQLLQGQGQGSGQQHLPPMAPPNQPYPQPILHPLPPPNQPARPTTSTLTPSPAPPPESSATGNVAPTIPLQDPVQLPQQLTTAMHSITDRLDILIAGMGQMFQLPLQALAYQHPQQVQPQLQAIPNQPAQPLPPQPAAPTAPITSTPPPATPGATSTASTQVELPTHPHTPPRRSRSNTHRHHRSSRRSRSRSHRRRRSPRSQHRQRGPTARSEHHPSKTTSRSIRLIPNPRGPTPYDAFPEHAKERRPLSRPRRRQNKDMDVRRWREEEQPDEPSESATPAQSTQRISKSRWSSPRSQLPQTDHQGTTSRTSSTQSHRLVPTSHPTEDGKSQKQPKHRIQKVCLWPGAGGTYCGYSWRSWPPEEDQGRWYFCWKTPPIWRKAKDHQVLGHWYYSSWTEEATPYIQTQERL